MYARLEDGYGDRSSSENNVEGGWRKPPGLRSVVLEPSPDKEVPLTDPFLDPREVYLRELFTPNRFSAHTLRKALSVSRGHQTCSITDLQYPYTKSDICVGYTVTVHYIGSLVLIDVSPPDLS